MAAELLDNPLGGPVDPTGMLSFYDKAKRQEWKVGDLPWDDVPPVPEVRAGASARYKGRMGDMWRSVLTQQLQADELAVQMSNQLLQAAPDNDAKRYYTTMVQDEARHTETWIKLLSSVGEPTDHDPHLNELVRMVLEADTLPEKIFMMQVFYEKAIISRFDVIAASAGGTVLEDLCVRLKKDDGIHHASGVQYEGVLLQDAPDSAKRKVEATARTALPVFVRHALWRPPERNFVGGEAMRRHDEGYVLREVSRGMKNARKLGLQLDDVAVEFPE